MSFSIIPTKRSRPCISTKKSRKNQEIKTNFLKSRQNKENQH